jgi:hypothetical protein
MRATEFLYEYRQSVMEMEDTPPEVLRALDQAAQKNGYRNWADVKANPRSPQAVMTVAKLASTILRTTGPHHEKLFYKNKIDVDENFADGKTLDPEIYGEMLPTATVKRIVTGVMNQVDPDAKVTVKQSPEGYYIVRSEGLRLDFGITADGGEIGANIVNAYSSYKGKNVVTEIFGQCFKAAEQLWGKPSKFVVSVQQDRGDGVWQAIAKKLGAEWGGSVMENFADGRVKGKSRPGRVKRAGASCNGSVTDLRTRAKRASGEKAKMYHWCANMKAGKKK